MTGIEQYSGSKTLTLTHYQTEDRHRHVRGPVPIDSVTYIALFLHEKNKAEFNLKFIQEDFDVSVF